MSRALDSLRENREDGEGQKGDQLLDRKKKIVPIQSPQSTEIKSPGTT